jgi:hypothetical protein
MSVLFSHAMRYESGQTEIRFAWFASQRNDNRFLTFLPQRKLGNAGGTGRTISCHGVSRSRLRIAIRCFED